MEVEKRGSKGGFLQLFDWNAKSRKKLFSNKSELPEGSKQGKENADSVGMSRPQQVHENGLNLSVQGCSDYNCASSASGDDRCGTKAPGVVARLMGLDCLPTSNVSESSSTPFFDSSSFRSLKITTDFQSEHHIIDYGNMRNKLDGFSMNPVELRLQKLQNRPIERFQTEMLPPKSAKSIPITHHKLLSPIKSPAFIPTKNVSYIMEAASKIIDQSPRSTTIGKLPSFKSSSVPLKILDLKEKMEAAQKASRLPQASQRAKEHSSVNYLKRRPSDRSQSGSEDDKLVKASVVSKKGGSESLKNKGKSVSLAVQAKANVQRRDGSNLRVGRSFMNQKEDNGVKLGHHDKNQPNAQKGIRMGSSTGKTSDVLRQNNQKQNCASNKAKRSSKPSVSPREDTKPLFVNCSSRSSKNLNKAVVDAVVGSKKISSVATDTAKEPSYSKPKKSSGNKLPANGDLCFDGVVDPVQMNKNERSVKCNVAMDGCTHWDAIYRKNGTDVVSFTFTSPIKKSAPGNHVSGQLPENNSTCINSYDNQSDSKNSTFLHLGVNVVGGDALSVLLEQKLKELTFRVESSHHDLLKQGSASSPASSSQDSVPTLGVANTISMEHDKRYQLRLHKDKPDMKYNFDKPDIQYGFDCPMVDELWVKAKQQWQSMEEMLELNSSSDNSGCEKEPDYGYPSSVSSLEPSFSEGSCNSSDCKTSFNNTGSKQFLSVETLEMLDWISAKKSQSAEGDTQLCDSASSIFVGSMDRKDVISAFSSTNFRGSSFWELDYISDILSEAELTVKEFSLGQVHKVITPDLFDQLENQRKKLSGSMEEHLKSERKVVFDCVCECLEFRCEQLIGGRFKASAKWTRLFQRKEWLAEELYKEISSWSSMEELMVDEVVDKDMSSQYGKWVEFEIEASEEGSEIEKRILTSLVDELVTDLI